MIVNGTVVDKRPTLLLTLSVPQKYTPLPWPHDHGGFIQAGNPKLDSIWKLPDPVKELATKLADPTSKITYLDIGRDPNDQIYLLAAFDGGTIRDHYGLLTTALAEFYDEEVTLEVTTRK